MKTPKRLLALGAMVASAMLVTACVGDEADTPDASAAETTAEPTDAATPDESADFDDETPEDVTAPGSVLALGDTAVLEHPIDGEDDATGLLAATVHEIEAGTAEQLEELDLGEQAEGLTPYYLRITIAGVDETSAALAGSMLTNAFSGLSAGSPVANLNIIGSWDVCDTSSLDGEWSAESTQEICIIALAPEAGSVDAVHYAPRDEQYRSSPVVWEQ